MTRPITPPSELVQQWDREWREQQNAPVIGWSANLLAYVAARAAQWGADQQLAEDAKWLDHNALNEPHLRITPVGESLKEAMRPKPLTLKEQALCELVDEISEPLKLTPEQAQQIRDLLAPEPRRNYPAKPDSSLVERIATAIALVDEEHYWPEARDAVETDMARAAIREVALWLNEAPLDLYPGDRGIVVNALYDQANQ